MKCMPITCLPRSVTAAMAVMEIEEVLLAKIASGFANSAISLKIFNLRSRFSVAASTTKSALATPNFKSVKVLILVKVAVFSASVKVPLLTCLSKFLAIVAIPLASALALISIKLT
ncbi:hypothetical protein D9M68_918160 [compost metagenome]